MKIKMRTTLAGPSGVLSAGQVADVSDEEGKALVDRGFAEAMDKAPEQKIETADQQPQETTAKRRGRK